MKCPICHGKGRIQDHKYNEEHDIEYLVYCEKKCEYCNGTGEVQMTNEQWLRSATFEELAGAIYEWHSAGYTKGRLELGLNPITEIVEWLKEKHE